MDAGVGGFIFSAALTSSAARRRALADGGSSSPSLRLAGLRLLPVAGLGLLRLLAVKLLNYQEHVTEYGTHWNFFFTLTAGRTAENGKEEGSTCSSFSRQRA